ncbi:hypothetical protein BGZ67_006525 [Mortierella alpina]|nr:hypothetical protein BGZ67_006525 [Mortierella alpina]
MNALVAADGANAPAAAAVAGGLSGSGSDTGGTQEQRQHEHEAMVAQQGIAQGTALKNVSAENDQDLMFMAGEQVVLLERLGDGLCMGYCEGVVGRFQESNVDFSSSESSSTLEPAAASDTASKKEEVNSVFSVLSRHSLMTAIALDPEATTRPGPRKLLSEENLQVSLGSRTTESGPLPQQQQQHPQHPHQVQKPALIASMALHPENIQHSSVPVIPPRSSSRQSNKKATKSTKRSSGAASLVTGSSKSSISSSTIDQTSSTAEGELTGDQSRLSPIPSRQQQRSAASSANDSVASSRAPSPVVVDKETPARISRPVTPILHGNGLGQQPPTSKSRAQYSRRQSIESPQSQRLLDREREQRLSQEHEHYLSSVLEDIRSKTHHVLQKAGFSMAPNAGLYADRGSKEDDLDLATVVQMPSAASTTVAEAPGLATVTESTAAAGLAAVTKVSVQTAIPAPTTEGQEAESNETLANGVSFAITTAPPTPKNNSNNNSSNVGFWSRPRSRSLFRDENPGTSMAQIAQSSSLSDTAVADVSLEAPTTTIAPSFMSGFEKLRPWSRLGQRQRSNSGPVRYADAARVEAEAGDCGVHEMESSHVIAVEAASGTAAVVVVPSQQQQQQKQAQQNEIKKAPSLRQRRVSEGMTITVNSMGSTQSGQAPLAPGMTIAATIAEQRAQANASKHRSKNWFGIAKRTSGQYVEDTRKPHQLGHGIEGGIVSRHLSALMADGEDDEEDENEFEEEEEDCEGRKSGENARIYVNDFGFIYDLDDEMNQGQDLTGTGSAVGMESGLVSNASTVSGIERKRADRKHKFIRENELKWMHAITQMPADNVKKSTKYKKLVRRGVPTSVRGRVWLFLAKADVYRQPGLFDELMKRGPLPIHEVIERDIHRCYPDHIHFRDGMGGTGQQDLHSVLKAYAHYKPSVGYCQGMGRLVGMMLMQMPVEDAFWLLVATIENYMQDYYTPTLRQLRIDAQVFERLLKDQDPALAEHLERNDVIPLMYMTQWFMTLFTMSLPWASVLRVWDVFYYDGVKALFRVGLAILQLCREHLLNKCPSSSELLAFILHIPLDFLGPKALLDAALNIKLRKQSVQRLIAVTAETMDAAAKAKEQPTAEASPPSSTPSASTTTAPAVAASSESDTSTTAANSSSTTIYPTPNSNTDTQPASPASASSSSISVSASSPPSAASSPPSTVPSTAASSRPISQTSSSPTSMPSASAPSSFSPLGVFKARRRAGTVQH